MRQRFRTNPGHAARVRHRRFSTEPQQPATIGPGSVHLHNNKTKQYWEQWALDVAKIAERRVMSIGGMVSREWRAKTEFEPDVTAIGRDINRS